ncbi:MAG: hypothetical protein HC788_09745 [Sphingopyxis sp.]|nr:hypothetical protein [Sphingopyxis sp.]
MTNGPDRETAIDIYRTMARIAATDLRIQQGLAAGDLQFQYYPCGGQEAIPAAIAPLLTKDDKSVITYRCIHDIVAKGTPIREIIAEMYGRETGTSKGKGGPMHLSDPNSGLMVTTGIVGSGIPIANGFGIASQLDGTDQVTVVNFGGANGTAQKKAYYEPFEKLAGVKILPVEYNGEQAKVKAMASRRSTYQRSTPRTFLIRRTRPSSSRYALGAGVADQPGRPRQAVVQGQPRPGRHPADPA